MITLTAGVTGSGKTLSTVKFIADTLLYTRRIIVTQIQELELEKIQAYCDAKCVERSALTGQKIIWKDDVTRRIFIIPRASTSHYYRYRGLKTYEKFESIKGETIELLDVRLEEYFKQMSGDGVGVAYIMDELHRHFRSERWDEISDAVMFHLAQHRHLDDEFWGVSQNPEQIAIRFNRQVHEYHLWENHYKQQFGIFGKPGGFYRRSYYYVPKTGDKGATPFSKETIKLDLALASLYRTRGALGGAAVGVETEVKKRFKLPWWMIIVFAVIGFALAVGLFVGMMKGARVGLAAAFNSGSKAVRDQVGPKAVLKPEPETAVTGGAQQVAPVLLNAPNVPQNPPVTVLSVVHTGSTYIIRLSDGSTLTDETRKVRSVSKAGVELINGQILQYAPIGGSGNAPKARALPPSGAEGS